MVGWLRYIWNDTRLSWDKDEWDGLDRLRVPATQLWLPDITLYNSVGKMENTYLSWEQTSRAVIMSSGMVSGRKNVPPG